jgi:hypothetical protein
LNIVSVYTIRVFKEKYKSSNLWKIKLIIKNKINWIIHFMIHR